MVAEGFTRKSGKAGRRIPVRDNFLKQPLLRTGAPPPGSLLMARYSHSASTVTWTFTLVSVTLLRTNLLRRVRSVSIIADSMRRDYLYSLLFRERYKKTKNQLVVSDIFKFTTDHQLYLCHTYQPSVHHQSHCRDTQYH